jgi:hypothetical protein
MTNQQAAELWSKIFSHRNNAYGEIYEANELFAGFGSNVGTPALWLTDSECTGTVESSRPLILLVP